MNDRLDHRTLINRHYAPDDLEQIVVEALQRAGKAERLAPDDLAPLDQFHSLRERLAAMLPAPPPLGLHLLLGEVFRPAFDNFVRNLAEGRVAVARLVAGKT